MTYIDFMRLVISSLADSSHVKKDSDYQQINKGFLLACRNRLGELAIVDAMADDNMPFYHISCSVDRDNIADAYQIVVDELRTAGYDTENCRVVFCG